jgi:SAM-dependent methyltransferase
MSGCEGYTAIARIYDKLNADISYKKWADFVEASFDKYLGARPELVLDLACGTGSMALEMASRGYDMIGVDGSEDMLNVAYERSFGKGILYLCQDMRSFELYGTVGAVLCCLDSINYLLSEEDVKRTFSLVHNYLDPDGLFLFDMNTPFKFENIYSDNAYILEDEMIYEGEDKPSAVFCGWQNQYDKESGVCDFYLSVFSEDEDGKYYREDEHQRERCYTLEAVKRLLSESGLELVGCFADFDFNAPADTTERWYFAAIARK